jgi:hypothetical protein
VSSSDRSITFTRGARSGERISSQDVQCEGKARFASYRAALRSIRRDVRGFGRGVRLVPYYCSFCCGFHLGNSGQRAATHRKAA